MSILAIVDSLKANSSRLAKEDILRKNKDNDVLRRFFYLALNPYIQFYQRKIPKYTPANVNQADSLDSVFDSLDMLSTRQVTGNAAIDHLTKLLSSLTEDDAKVLEMVIQKDPDCGVSEGTVNKIWPDLIPSFPVMLCSPYEQKLVDRLHWNKGVYAQLKSDGMRCMIVVDGPSVTAYTRNGRVIETHGVFDYFAKYNKRFVIDGELLVRGNDGKFLDRKTGNGLCNKALKGTGTRKQAEAFFLNAWDYIPLDDFREGICTDTYKVRFTYLQGIVGDIHYFNCTINVGVIETRVINTLDEAQALFEDYLAKGEEGLILKDKPAIWEDTRSKSLIKMKAERDADLLCVNVILGTGKYEGKIGSLVCQSSDSLITVNVGSGLNDEDRSQDASKYVNRIIEVVYNEKIKSKDGTHSLFLPRFIAVREDKNTANSFKEIK